MSGSPRWLGVGEGFPSFAWEWMPTRRTTLYATEAEALRALGRHGLGGLPKWVEEVDVSVWAVTCALLKDEGGP